MFSLTGYQEVPVRRRPRRALVGERGPVTPVSMGACEVALGSGSTEYPVDNLRSPVEVVCAGSTSTPIHEAISPPLPLADRLLPAPLVGPTVLGRAASAAVHPALADQRTATLPPRRQSRLPRHVRQRTAPLVDGADVLARTPSPPHLSARWRRPSRGSASPTRPPTPNSRHRVLRTLRVDTDRHGGPTRRPAGASSSRSWLPSLSPGRGPWRRRLRGRPRRRTRRHPRPTAQGARSPTRPLRPGGRWHHATPGAP